MLVWTRAELSGLTHKPPGCSLPAVSARWRHTADGVAADVHADDHVRVRRCRPSVFSKECVPKKRPLLNFDSFLPRHVGDCPGTSTWCLTALCVWQTYRLAGEARVSHPSVWQRRHLRVPSRLRRARRQQLDIAGGVSHVLVHHTVRIMHGKATRWEGNALLHSAFTSSGCVMAVHCRCCSMSSPWL